MVPLLSIEPRLLQQVLVTSCTKNRPLAVPGPPMPLMDGTLTPPYNTTNIADTLAWFPLKVLMPHSSSADIAISAARDLIAALLLSAPSSPLVPLHDSHGAALHQLVDIFAHHTGHPVPPKSPPAPPGFALLPPPMHSPPLPRVSTPSPNPPAALPRVRFGPTTEVTLLPFPIPQPVTTHMPPTALRKYRFAPTGCHNPSSSNLTTCCHSHNLQ
jgi:hypothetical protein